MNLFQWDKLLIKFYGLIKLWDEGRDVLTLPRYFEAKLKKDGSYNPHNATLYSFPQKPTIWHSLSVSVLAAMPSLSCRFYQHRFPEVEDVVMVNVRSIAEMGAYVSLLEYNNIEGMILLSELSRRRIRSINKLIRIGRNECVVVIRVDKEKGECRQGRVTQWRWEKWDNCWLKNPFFFIFSLRIHWSIEKKSFTRGGHQVWR